MEKLVNAVTNLILESDPYEDNYERVLGLIVALDPSVAEVVINRITHAALVADESESTLSARIAICRLVHDRHFTLNLMLPKPQGAPCDPYSRGVAHA